MVGTMEKFEESVDQSVEKEKLRSHFENLNKYLNPPYIYEIPKDRLKIGDENYQYYICRATKIFAISGGVDNLLGDKSVNFTEEERETIQQAHDKMAGLKGEEIRTEEEMGMIKDQLSIVVDIIKNKLED